MPTASALTPSVVTRKSGSRLWMSSEEVSINSDTTPSVHTPAGMFRHAAGAARFVGCCAGLLTKVEGSGQIACARPHAGQRLESEAARDELDYRGRVVRRVIDVAAFCERRNDDRWDARAGTPAVAGRRRHMVPKASVFVVGHDDRYVL